jgi:hypothetical protein
MNTLAEYMSRTTGFRDTGPLDDGGAGGGRWVAEGPTQPSEWD